MCMTVWVVKDMDPIPRRGENQRLFRSDLLIFALIKEMNRRGIGGEVIRFASRFEHGRKAFLEGESPLQLGSRLKVYLLDGRGYKKNISLQRIGHNTDIARDFERIAENLPRPDVAVIMYPAPELALAAAAFCQKHKVPYVVDFRDPWPDSFVNYFPSIIQPLLMPLLWRYRRMIREIVKGAGGIVSMGERMLEWASSYRDPKDKKLAKMFPIGYKPLFNADKKIIPQQFTPDNPLTCIYIGLFGETYKGDKIIEAFNILNKEGENRVRCIFGGKGKLESQWKALAEGNPLIEFKGWLNKDDIKELLQQGHVGLIMLAKGIKEFWRGNKLYEYMSGKMALAVDASEEVNRYVEEQRIGFVVGDGSPEELARGIRRYLDNPHLLREHSERALNEFREKFDSDKVYQDYASFVLSVAERNANAAKKHKHAG